MAKKFKMMVMKPLGKSSVKKPSFKGVKVASIGKKKYGPKVMAKLASKAKGRG